MTSPVSLRLPKDLDAKVRTIAQIERRTLAETVNMLTEEAIKIREFPEITFVSGPTGRRARLLSGPDVWEVLEPYVLGDRNWTDLRESYPHLDEATLRVALRYYQSYPEEIESRIRFNQGE